jgi:phosphonoacetaldehyde hydrolase
MSKSSINRLQAVILDWAGTTIDHGSLAPIRTLQQVFAKRGITLSDAVARKDMGIAKLDHIRNLFAEPEVIADWAQQYGSQPQPSDVEEIYAQFIPLQMDCLLQYSQLIEGVAETVERFRSKGLKIASTTGYTRPMLEDLLTVAAKQGYRPDQSLCPEDVGAGRPHPYMCYRLAIDLKTYPLWTCVKIGDTESDIAEGLNAGMWTIGVTRTGNMVGLSEADWKALDTNSQAQHIQKATESFKHAGAHYVIDTVADSLPVLEEIAMRLKHGDRP